LPIDKRALSVVQLLTPLDLLVPMADLRNNGILQMNHFNRPRLHKILNFAKDSNPVAMGGLLSVSEKADGIICFPHCLVLQNLPHMGGTIHISVMLQALFVENEIPGEGIIEISQPQLFDDEGGHLFL
jgi:hypothetical protein